MKHRTTVCRLCKNNAYITLPMHYEICNDFLGKTIYSYKKCPLCIGLKIDVLQYPFSLQGDKWLEDYKVGSHH